MNKMTITQVKKQIKENGSWKGFMLPNKMNPNTEWAKAYKTELQEHMNIDMLIERFKTYNCNYEMGYGVAYYASGE